MHRGKQDREKRKKKDVFKDLRVLFLEQNIFDELTVLTLGYK